MMKNGNGDAPNDRDQLVLMPQPVVNCRINDVDDVLDVSGYVCSAAMSLFFYVDQGFAFVVLY